MTKESSSLWASTIGRFKDAWSNEHARWSERDFSALSAKRYVHFFLADSIHVQARLEDDAQCLLVIIGAMPEGKKEFVGLIDGVRESTQFWRELLLDLKRRGLEIGPELSVADGALRFWQAVEEVWPKTRGQRCWVHKTSSSQPWGTHQLETAPESVCSARRQSAWERLLLYESVRYHLKKHAVQRDGRDRGAQNGELHSPRFSFYDN